MNWNNIRALQGSQQEGFEELVCQLARKEIFENQKKFIRKGKPDAGIECYWILNNDKEVAWQAKYFLTSLEASQWKQIDKSVESALEKHPNLIKYYIAIPNDPPDARIEGKNSMLDRWNNRVEKWEEIACLKGMSVEFLPWWSSDLIEKLQRPENVGLNYYWFNKSEFTDEWLNTNNELAIKALGKRYTPEIHVELDIVKIFDSISRDEHFKKRITSIIDQILVKYNKINKKFDEAKVFLQKIENGIANLWRVFQSTDICGISQIDYDEYKEILRETFSASDELYSFYQSKNMKRLDEAKQKRYGSEMYELNEFNSSLNLLSDFLYSEAPILSIQPSLLIQGEAGIGKSHLLADAVNRRTKEKKVSLLLLGQHFVTDEDPWVQISKKLQLKCDINEFLGALESRAQISGSRCIIFIDAINEGKGRFFWRDNLASFIHRISKYKWLGLVLSIRSSYIDLIAPKEEFTDKSIMRYTHNGFSDVEYKASKIFFTNYGIELPSIPLLHPEFQNPLFLKLFCEGLNKAGYTRIPDGFQGVSSVFDFFIDSINKKLQRPNELDYSINADIVRKAIDALIKEKMDTGSRYIEWEKAYSICEDILSKFSHKRNLIDALISEGLLNKNCFYLSDGVYEEGIYLAYERFEDHMIASRLLNDEIELDKEFNENGNLFSYVKDEHSCYLNKGIIDAIAIQLPEKFSREIYEFTEHLNFDGQRQIANSFLKSLIWRKTETIHEGLKDYINSVILRHKILLEEFLNVLITVSVVPSHYFNAHSLHKFLFKTSMPKRDAWWSFDYLGRKMDWASPVKSLIDWCWNYDNKNHISDESIILASITLSWFLSSPNRLLRDYSTKALISLLKDRLHLVVNLLREFDGVNDPYIYERLFAVAYGASLRTSETKTLSELSQYIFETIFNKEEIYPHILLRDYARGVIEYANFLKITLDFDIEKIRPPYKSSFFGEALTNKEIDDKYEIDYGSEEYRTYHISQNTILHSMTTEHGRGGGYGDFGRYVFQSALRSWNIDPDKLSNKAIELIFEKYGYDVEVHGKLDIDIPYTGRSSNSFERIGKKYQWLAFYEILARVSDNIKDFDDSGFYYEQEENEMVYEGPWNPYVRDIDPTLLIKDTGDVDEDVQVNFWWTETDYIETDCSNDEWLSSENDLPDFPSCITVKDNDGVEWFVLEGYPEWGEKRPIGKERYEISHKRIWSQIRSYLVKNDDYHKLTEWANKQNFWGRWMPESTSRYQLFHREFYWSPAYDFFQQDYYNGEQWRNVRGSHHMSLDFKLMVTADNYLWEEEYDFSKEKTINILKPTKFIYEKMGLIYSENDGEFMDESGHLICFDASVYNDSKQFLLIKKEEFSKFLEDENLKVVWTIIGEKQILGKRFTPESKNRFHNMEFSGFFKLNEYQDVKGDIKIELR